MSFIVAAKEVTESCVSVGDALAIKEIKPSGTLGYRFIKRLFDLVFSLLMSVLLLIPLAVVCALISLESPGSPMYTQERVGKGGKTIKIFKLRSMVADANDVRKYLSPEQLHQWEVERKVDDDPRITRVGKYIRKCSIDEMPQFLNVLNGDLSVIGPRPITRDELEQHFSDEEKAELLSVRPGILVCGRQPIVTRQPLRAACVRRLSFAMSKTVVLLWIGSALLVPSGLCLVRRERDDRCRQTLLLPTVC